VSITVIVLSIIIHSFIRSLIVAALVHVINVTSAIVSLTLLAALRFICWSVRSQYDRTNDMIKWSNRSVLGELTMVIVKSRKPS
jgi:hypothetical protein